MKAVLHDEIHKVMNDILCGLLTYLHMGIMKCTLGKLSHTEHQENLSRNNAVPLDNEFPVLQSIIVLSVSVLDKGTTFLQKIRNHSPTDTAGNKTEISAYRPVSLLTSFSKIFEKVIYNRLLKHTQVNNIITMDQYGFKNNSSTELAIFKLINSILTSINNKDAVYGIFYDVSKAFDTLNHEILVSKLKYYGITGVAGELIKSYLSNRFQRVRIRNSQLDSST